MKELIKRHEAISHLTHAGQKDPNLVIYNWYKKSGSAKMAEEFLEYRKNWELASSGKKLPGFPLFVTFGLNDTCNLSCAHCYRKFNKTKTKKKRLEFKEVCRLIDEAKACGTYSIGLGTESELFLYPYLKKLLRYIAKRDFLDIWICTNGIMLNNEFIKLILDAQITRLSISIDAITEQTYRNVRGEGFYKVMSNIFKFLDARGERHTKLPVLRVTFIKYNLTQHESKRFIDFWGRIADEVDVQSLIDVKNIDILKHQRIKNGRCNYPNRLLYVNWNGDYKPCCSEFCKHLTIGNISNMSLMQAWGSEYMQDLRKQLQGKECLNKACVNCLRSLHSKETYASLKARQKSA